MKSTLLSLALIALAGTPIQLLAHPGPAHVHVLGEDTLQVLLALALVALLAWFVRKRLPW